MSRYFSYQQKENVTSATATQMYCRNAIPVQLSLFFGYCTRDVSIAKKRINTGIRSTLGYSLPFSFFLCSFHLSLFSSFIKRHRIQLFLIQLLLLKNKKEN